MFFFKDLIIKFLILFIYIYIYIYKNYKLNDEYDTCITKKKKKSIIIIIIIFKYVDV